MATVYSIAFVLSAGICLSIAWASWRRRPAAGALGLTILCAAQSWWSAVYAFQWMFTDREPSLLWLFLRFPGLQATPTAILILVLEFTGRRRLLSGRNVALLALQPLLMFGLALTDPIHGLYLGGHEPAFKVISGGPAWWFNIAYSYAVILVAAVMLLARLARRHPYKTQTAVLFIAVMLPVVHFLLQLTGFELLPGVNSVPFMYTVTGVLLWYALTRLGLFKVIPVARELLIEQMAEGIIVFDGNARIADINPSAMDMMQTSISCVGKTADEAFPQHARAIAELRAGLLTDSRASVRTSLGTQGVLEVTASAVGSRDGGRIATLVTLRDITEQTRAAAELAKRGEQLEAALERSSRILAAMTDGVLLVNAENVVVQGNPAAGRILGMEGSDLRGQSLGELVPALPARDLVDEAAAAAGPVVTTLTLPNGRSVTFELIPLLVADSRGSHALLVVRDETERLAAERMQRDFVANAAHELQTPLTGLSLLADTIPRALRNDPEHADVFVNRLAIEIQRLTLMTRELMTLSRVDASFDPGSGDVIDLSKLTAEEIAQIEPLASKKQQAITLDAVDQVMVAGSRIDLSGILGNLLGNAVHCTDSGGHVEVRLLVEEDPDGREWAVLEVADDGPGIPEGDLERIFERFYRVDKARSRQTGGAGLGLSIVRQAAERHGGSVAVQSVLGEGTTFTVKLPVSV